MFKVSLNWMVTKVLLLITLTAIAGEMSPENLELYENIIHNVNRGQRGVHLKGGVNKTDPHGRSHHTSFTDRHSDPAYQDVSSPEFRKLAEVTYQKVFTNCIAHSWMTSNKKLSDYKFPSDAQLHFETIRNVTAPYRQAPVHEYSNYEGKMMNRVNREPHHTRFIETPSLTAYLNASFALYITLS